MRFARGISLFCTVLLLLYSVVPVNGVGPWPDPLEGFIARDIFVGMPKDELQKVFLRYDARDVHFHPWNDSFVLHWMGDDLGLGDRPTSTLIVRMREGRVLCAMYYFYFFDKPTPPAFVENRFLGRCHP